MVEDRHPCLYHNVVCNSRFEDVSNDFPRVVDRIVFVEVVIAGVPRHFKFWTDPDFAAEFFTGLDGLHNPLVVFLEVKGAVVQGTHPHFDHQWFTLVHCSKSKNYIGYRHKTKFKYGFWTFKSTLGGLSRRTVHFGVIFSDYRKLSTDIREEVRFWLNIYWVRL